MGCCQGQSQPSLPKQSLEEQAIFEQEKLIPFSNLDANTAFQAIQFQQFDNRRAQLNLTRLEQDLNQNIGLSSVVRGEDTLLTRFMVNFNQENDSKLFSVAVILLGISDEKTKAQLLFDLYANQAVTINQEILKSLLQDISQAAIDCIPNSEITNSIFNLTLPQVRQYKDLLRRGQQQFVTSMANAINGVGDLDKPRFVKALTQNVYLNNLLWATGVRQILSKESGIP